MKLLNRIKSAFSSGPMDLREPRGWDVSIAPSGEVVSQSSVMALSSVWACINLIAGTIATLPIGVYRLGPNGIDVLADEHPLQSLLKDSPNFDQTIVDFMEGVCASLELYGNAYVRISREGSRVVGLYMIQPSLVSVKRLDTGALEYSWSDDGRSYRVGEANILHIRGFGGDPLGGLSTLKFARKVFGLAQAVDRSAGETFRNGLRPSGVLKFKEWLSPDQRNKAETVLTDKFMGAQNAGRPMILEGDTEWVPLAIKPEDAQMLQSRQFSVEEICRFFGVPPFMIGHTEKTSSWGSGIEQQTLGFQKFTLRRRLKKIEAAMEKKLLSPADRNSGYKIKFNIEGLLRGDTEGRAAFYQTMTQIGAMTINEVRRLESLPEVEGGEVPRLQMQNIPINEAGNEN